MILPVPNEVLDVRTLKFIREGVEREKRLARGAFHKGFLRKTHCAVGTRFPGGEDVSGEEFVRWIEANELDAETLGKIMSANDKGTPSWVYEETRRDLMLDWLNRCIAYAENVAKEIERLGSSSVANRVLGGDTARCPDTFCAACYPETPKPADDEVPVAA